MNTIQLMNSVFCQGVVDIAGELFNHASLQKHNNYRLKVLESCLDTNIFKLVLDLAETEFSSSSKKKHDLFKERVNALKNEYSKPQVQQAIYEKVNPFLETIQHQQPLITKVVIGGEEISSDQARTLSLSRLKKLARQYGKENPQDAMTHVHASDVRTILRHIWRI